MTPIFQIKLRSDLRYIDTLPLSVKTTLLNETKNDWLHWLASSKVLCCSSFALFSCVCSSMIYRVTLSKGWISKDTGTVADRWKTIIFLLMWLFVNWLIRGDCEDDSTLRLESDVSVSVIINKPRVAVEQYFPPCHRETETEPCVLQEMEPDPVAKCSQETEKQIAQIRAVSLSLTPTLAKYHRSYLYCQEREHFSTNWEWPLHKQGGRMLCQEPRHTLSWSP